MLVGGNVTERRANLIRGILLRIEVVNVPNKPTHGYEIIDGVMRRLPANITSDMGLEISFGVAKFKQLFGKITNKGAAYDCSRLITRKRTTNPKN